MSTARNRRPSAWLALLGLAAALGLHVPPAGAAVPALTAGTWTITGSDIAGIDWTVSKISFESQVARKTGYEVSGYFDWTGSNGAYGREKFAEGERVRAVRYGRADHIGHASLTTNERD